MPLDSPMDKILITPIAPERKRFRKSSTPDSELSQQSTKMSNTELKDMLNDMFDNKLEPLYERFNSIDETVKSYRSEISALKKSLAERDGKITRLERDFDELKRRQISMESQSRRNNLKVYGIPESRGEVIEAKLDRFFLESGININCYALERAHRLGPYKPGQPQPRPIIMKFSRFADREMVWHKANRRSSQGMYMQEDFPVEIDNDRRRLLPVYHAIQKYRWKTKILYKIGSR